MKYFVESLPRSCFYCDCCHTKDFDYKYKIDGDKFCGIENMEVNDFYDYNHETRRRPDWCPLREIPQKKITKYSDAGNMYRGGWNDCIDEMIGE